MSAADFNILLVIVTAASILSKEAMYRYTIYYARKHDSLSMKADAWHHRSDAVSIAVLIGICGALIFEAAYFEQIAAIIVSLLIAKVAVDLFKLY